MVIGGRKFGVGIEIIFPLHGCNCRRETDSNLISWNYSQWKVEFGTNFLVENRVFWNESLEQDGYISNISFPSFLLFFFYLFIDSYRELERNDSILRLRSPYRSKFGMKIIFRSYGASNESDDGYISNFFFSSFFPFVHRFVSRDRSIKAVPFYSWLFRSGISPPTDVIGERDASVIPRNCS